MVNIENCYTFKLLNSKLLQTTLAMFAEDKVMEIFFMADEFCKVFDVQMEKYTVMDSKKRKNI